MNSSDGIALPKSLEMHTSISTLQKTGISSIERDETDIHSSADSLLPVIYGGRIGYNLCLTSESRLFKQRSKLTTARDTNTDSWTKVPQIYRRSPPSSRTRALVRIALLAETVQGYLSGAGTNNIRKLNLKAKQAVEPESWSVPR